MIRDLDAYRVGWELIDHARYSYWGGLRAVVVQFSRGCPHLCNYCGQRGFWTRWRHRDPVRFAKELARLHREHGVKVINFADENPTVSKKAWRAFLEALIAENVDLILVGSTRADDIVRDADILHLYKQAGWERFLLGMENTDETTLDLIRKGATTATDREAIRLMRQHGILSMATWVVGFEEETDRDHWRGLRQLLSYDPDQIQMLYVTPHRWTPYFRLAAGPPRDPDRPAPLGLQAPGAGDAPHAAVARAALVQVHRDGRCSAGRRRSTGRSCSIATAACATPCAGTRQMGRRVWPYEILQLPARPAARTARPSRSSGARRRTRKRNRCLRRGWCSRPATTRGRLICFLERGLPLKSPTRDISNGHRRCLDNAVRMLAGATNTDTPRDR